ncbi:hypothetical protein BKA56DRAFT_662462 [Ilyonectria sp. MPI-CAGE-AT-0026]|nr:hypothetical protein BKA56DRAFT_662462 [Ilyonectria sp. MPI-CAGE-AT-0026]
MKALLLPFLFSYVNALKEACIFEYGQWEPEPGQCFALVLRELGVNRQQVQDLNPGIDIDDIFPSIPYNVPYNVPRYSAVWINGCPPMLQLSDGADYPNSLVCGNEESTTSQPLSSTAKANATPSSPYASDDESTIKEATTTSVSRRPALPLSSLSTVQSQHEGDKKNIPSDTSSSQESNTSSTTPPTGEISTHLDIPSSKNTIQSSRTGSKASSSEETNSALKTLSAAGTATVSGSSFNHAADRTLLTKADFFKHGYDTRNLSIIQQHIDQKIDTSLATSTAEKSATASPDTLSSAATSAPTDTQTTKAVEDSTRTVIPSVTGLSTSSTNNNERESSVGSAKTTLSEELSKSSATASSHKVKETTETSDAQSTAVPTEKRNSKTTTTIVSSAIETETSSATTPSENSEETTTGTTSSDETSVAETSSSSIISSSHYSKNRKTTLHRTKSALREKATATTADLSQTNLPAPICGDEDELPGYGDIVGWSVQTSAELWCNDESYQRSVSPEDKCSLGVEWLGGIGYEYSICWAEGCVGGAQDRKKPLGDDGPSCKDIMFRNWESCKFDNSRNFP